MPSLRRFLTRNQLIGTAAVVATCLAACGPAPPVPVSAAQSSAGDPDPPRPNVVSSTVSARSTATLRLVALGDSLTAGLGLAPDEAYPAHLQARLDAAGYDVMVVNAGVSGETTAGGLRRLEWALEGDVALLIVALGGNDGLRGLPVEQMKDNLDEIITQAKYRGAEILLIGMEAPPNFGQAYTEAFRRVFSDLAHEHEVGFVPFLLEGVAGEPGLNQADGIHPNARGAQEVAAHLWPVVESLVDRVVGEVVGSSSVLERQ